MKFLIHFYASVSALATVVTPTAMLAGFVLVARPVRKPGRVINQTPLLRKCTDARIRVLICDAEGALDGLGIRHPKKWGDAELKLWALAERGRWANSVSLLLLSLITILTGALLTALVKHHWDMAMKMWLPSYAFFLLTVCYTQLDLIAIRRGRAPAYVQWAAVSALVACQAHADGGQTNPATTAHLSRNMERLSDALVTYGQFGVSRKHILRAALLAQCAGMSHRLEKAFEACLRDRSQVTALAEHIVCLIDTLGRQEPLNMVPQAESRSTDAVSTEPPLPWRLVLGHLLAFLTGVGLVVGFKALGLSSEYLVLLAPLIYLMVQIPYLAIGRIPAALRHIPHLTTPPPGSESDANASADAPPSHVPVALQNDRG
ncbi:hypothetical protein ACIQMP_12195 [Streptomyces sp. NPDC091385]|uniref:hypothetical protein n=1 Tax=Streptomyces sp. NPDC091385 TaxID=3365997 RepID=UPI003810CA17